MLRTRRTRSRLAAALTLSTVLAATAAAQNTATVPPAACRGTVPAPFAKPVPAAVTVRIMAEGEFPDEDVATARALVLMTDELLGEGATGRSSARVDVDRSISPTVSSVADARGLNGGSSLLTAIVQRTRDTVTVLWKLRVVGNDATPARSERVIVRVQELPRAARLLADLATRAASGAAPSGAVAPAALPTTEAADAFIVGLAEALSPTPSALSRARALLVRATTLAPTYAAAWRWRARVEQMLLDWNVTGDASAMRGLRASGLAAALRAVQLAPDSKGAQVTLAEAYLGSGERDKAVSVLLDVAKRDASHPGMQRVSALLDRLRGNDARAVEQLRAAAARAPRDAPLLVELASLARLRGEQSLACHALNAAVVADRELASTYALRALVRAGYGELREAWADAEVATRLGHPEWGERAATVLDAKYAERTQAERRLQGVGGTGAVPLNYLDTILLAQAAASIAQPGRPLRVGTGLPCTSPLRPVVLRDLRTLGVAASDACSVQSAAKSQ